ncbi:hypothetical protein [Methanoplanus endosymbiosus]|uniref:Uncharacterized protein n=1 Tax=Methanoplanus endosymbiosus TaxID=33865 RepID=A0A9E7PRA1_9EURY|nr:hypothetical protein [Methanoplanus endosymbiosus]UUX92077.1 hypothetical protein L6E24_12040 [Methanoplanus endosymbiosus]
MDSSETIRQNLKAQSATNQSVEHQSLQFKKFLATESNDSLYDLTEEQIHAISAIRMADEETFIAYGGLPQARAFAEAYESLSRSRRRLGRIEGVGLGNRPITAPQQPYNRDVESERDYQREAMREQKGGLFGWLRGTK